MNKYLMIMIISVLATNIQAAERTYLRIEILDVIATSCISGSTVSSSSGCKKDLILCTLATIQKRNISQTEALQDCLVKSGN